jgi:serine/threonine protein kinase
MVAMERLAGTSLLSTITTGSVKDVHDIYWSAKAKLHKLGIAHNDSHAGNFIIGPDGKGKFIDFGLAVISPKNALSEALGGPTGSDGQSSPREGMVFNRIVKNLAAVRTKMANDGLSPNEIKSLERSGNRPTIVTGAAWEKMSDEQANKYLTLLYEGV